MFLELASSFSVRAFFIFFASSFSDTRCPASGTTRLHPQGMVVPLRIDFLNRTVDSLLVWTKPIYRTQPLAFDRHLTILFNFETNLAPETINDRLPDQSGPLFVSLASQNDIKQSSQRTLPILPTSANVTSPNFQTRCSHPSQDTFF